MTILYFIESLRIYFSGILIYLICILLYNVHTNVIQVCRGNTGSFRILYTSKIRIYIGAFFPCITNNNPVRVILHSSILARCQIIILHPIRTPLSRSAILKLFISAYHPHSLKMFMFHLTN